MEETSGEAAGCNTEETLGILVAEQWIVGCAMPHPTLDLRRRGLIDRDVVVLQTLWPDGMRVLNLVSV